MEKEEHIVIDANDGIMGRIASYAAKQALLGKKISIVNCEKVLISGRKNVLISTYREKLSKGGTAQKGPFIPRTAEGMFKRAVRGMLPWSKARGREALKRVMCYVGVPKDLENAKKINFNADFTSPCLMLKDLLKYI